MDSKRRGRMKRRIAALCVLLLVGFVSRYWLWRSVPILPYGLLPILRFDPQLRCASREEVLKRLGEPYYEEGRYSYVPAKEERAGVIFLRRFKSHFARQLLFLYRVVRPC
jgi:hypothetical protein